MDPARAVGWPQDSAQVMQIPTRVMSVIVARIVCTQRRELQNIVLRIPDCRGRNRVCQAVFDDR